MRLKKNNGYFALGLNAFSCNCILFGLDGFLIQFSVWSAFFEGCGCMAVDAKKEIANVAKHMDDVMADNSVPRNIRSAVEDAKNKAMEKCKEEDKGVAIGTAIYLLDDISNDINMPQHTRTEIWQIISELEAIKEKLK